MSIKSLYPDISPSFNLNFAESKSLDPRITFIRNSTATYVGSNGLIQDSRYGSPRFDHDPVTGESLGLLIEEQRTNIVTNSVNLSEYFTIIRTSEIDNSIVSPDGTTNASFLREDTELNNYHYIRRISPPTGTYTLSFYAKAGTEVGLLLAIIWVLLQTELVLIYHLELLVRSGLVLQVHPLQMLVMGGIDAL